MPATIRKIAAVIARTSMDRLKIDLAGVPAGSKILVGSATKADRITAAIPHHSRLANICLQKNS
jgi:hypothetical protein